MLLIRVLDFVRVLPGNCVAQARSLFCHQLMVTKNEAFEE
jgi:hypothetical protein